MIYKVVKSVEWPDLKTLEIGDFVVDMYMSTPQDLWSLSNLDDYVLYAVYPQDIAMLLYNENIEEVMPNASN